ncbi:hypothetical protein CKAH01_14664 [Colletotrichum kahawae]|uniref:GPI inositol-deacylase n=1 Tax=Colletotrichum kahawae TaxID=34407 RepID=A0AAD9YLF4_COLKA|nr:hypothetical protein CKAH01_14664 [Colletotrichum kahawae]
MKDMVAGNRVWYRARGLDKSYGLDDARGIILSMISGKEQDTFNLQSYLVPTCDDSSATQIILLSCDHPLACLKGLEDDPTAFQHIDINGDRLCFDRHFRGFTQMYANPPGDIIIADIIAIPDLNSHACSSWQAKSNSKLWIQDFFQKDLPQYRTLVYGYIPKFSVDGVESVQMYCNELLGWLHSVRQTSEEIHRPLILIGHGFGCLIAAQLLLRAASCEESWPMVVSLAESIQGMIFFAVPSKSDIIDEVQGMVKKEDICPSDYLIREINHMMDNLTDDLSEFQGYPQANQVLELVPLLSRKDVESRRRLWSTKFAELFSLDSSIISSLEGAKKVPGDRSTIGRLKTTSSPAYKWVVDYIQSREQKILDLRKDDWIKASSMRSNGITILHSPQFAVADVVLIPGLNGDPWDTWSCTPRSTTGPATLGKFWPQTYLPRSLSDTRILTWGLKSDRTCQLEYFVNQAPRLLKELSSARPLGRSLIFVAQDEAGLLLKEVLRLSEKGCSKSEKDIISCTSAVVFLVSQRSVGREDIVFDPERKHTSEWLHDSIWSPSSSNATISLGLASFQVLQETYGIQSTHLLEIERTSHSELIRP